MEVAVFWFRRDLRLADNTALNKALATGLPVLPVFIFDRNILNELPGQDARVTFIFDTLGSINNTLLKKGSSLLCLNGDPLKIWGKLTREYKINSVFVNKDYEPYAINRDKKIGNFFSQKGIVFNSFKDDVVFEENEIVKNDGKPYTVFTPYKNKWLQKFQSMEMNAVDLVEKCQFYKDTSSFPSLSELGFQKSNIQVKKYNLSGLDNYTQTRDIPSKETSDLGPHLRFGTVSIRQIIARLSPSDDVFMSELIWREFFKQILFHFPKVVYHNFKSKYDGIMWRNNKLEFELWSLGQTGYPLVDAGMRQLNATGYMHNRVRMVTAGFLCKHLLIDWRWGEAYFAQKLLDYELSSNNGNWQWAAGTGCDAAPYFRIFNPMEQLKKFDKNLEYVKKWVPEYGTSKYPDPIVDHKEARLRALEVYKKGLLNK